MSGLLAYRVAAGVTQDQAARALAVRTSTVRSWDRGERLGRVELRQLIALAALYGVRPVDLLPELLELRASVGE